MKWAVDRLALALYDSEAEELIREVRGPKLEPYLMTYERDLESRWQRRPYFELLDAWYDRGSAGGFNGYRW